MKTFKDLDFKGKPHMALKGMIMQSKMCFENGYGVSVITGYGAYMSPGHPYEVAVLKGDALCYDTPITNDVIGHCTPKDVTKIMKAVQELKND